MSLDARLGMERGSVVVCVAAPAGGLDSVLEHTAAGVPVVVCGGAEPAAAREVYWAANVEAAIAIADPADVVLVSGECQVAEGWLDGLRDAAHSESRVATASALPSAALVEVECSADRAAAAARVHSLHLRPRLPAPLRPCVYLRRSALELARTFDEGFYRRCSDRGLSHVLADDVVVAAESDGCAGEGGPVARAIGRVRRAVHGTSVVIDARILSREITGTEVQVLEVIGALARTGKVRLSVVVPDRLEPYARDALARLPDVALVRSAEASARGRADVVHRPYQVGNPGELAFLASLGERLVLTNQDLIAYHNRSYFEDGAAWQGYRRLTRLALAAADRVVFMSAHARDDALAEDLVEPDRASVVHNGVDHSTVAAGAHPAHPARPAGAARMPEDAETMLCLGIDYRHKNRPFAMRILERLRARHGWDGYLLFAGPSAPTGSSRDEEAELLAGYPELAGRVIDVGPVSEAEKAWLLRRARLVVYPTTYEGFGLVPFEAADHGVPCLWAGGTALGEVLPASAAAIVAWDPAASADRAFELIRDEGARARQVAAVREAAEPLTWDATAASLVELYEATCDAPAPPGSALQRAHGLMSGAISEDAMRLVGPGGALPGDVERPLLALATHRQLGSPLFGALKLGYRASYRLRRRGSRRD